MATVESWAGNIADIGPIYPMVGTETALVVIGVVAWLVWHVVQARRENRQFEEEERLFDENPALRALLEREEANNP